MRFLVDNAVSPLVASALREAGHDALHVRDIGLAAAEDEVIFDRAAAEVRLLLDNLSALLESLDAGALVTIEPTRVRVRQLPMT